MGLLVLAATGFALQLVTGRPAFGPFGLVLLVIPGFVISQIVRPSPRRWPELALTTFGTSLILLVFVGIAAGLSPQGLVASSVAAIELAILAVVAAGWYVRSTPTRPLRLPTRARVPASNLMIALGIVLAGAGIVVAMRAAQTREVPGFVQFWSVPPTAGADAFLGVRNATGVRLDCSVVIDRPNLSQYDLDIGTIEHGESWLGPLPPAAVGVTALWQISLHCEAADGSDIDRRLSIIRPAV